MRPGSGEESTATLYGARGRRRRCWAVLAFVAIGPLMVSCGGGDPEPAPDASPEESSESADNSAPDTAGSDGGSGDTSTASFDLFAKSVAAALDAENYEITSPTSVRFVFTEGTSDAPHRIECTSAGVVLPEGTEITMGYPDGDLACD